MSELKEIARLEYFNKHQEFSQKSKPVSEFVIMFKAYNDRSPTSEEISEYKKSSSGNEIILEDDYYNDEYEEDYEED